MAFIGNTPTAVPLTGSQIADGTIVNANIATNTINLTQKVTSTLPFAQGGTGLSTLGTAGQALIVNSSATALSYATVGATAGQVIQVASTNKVDTFTSSSTSYVDVTGLSVSITPSSASNKILVVVTSNMSSGTDDMLMRLVRDSTVIGSGTGGTVTNGFIMYAGGIALNSMMGSCINFLDSPSTTSSTTYKIQALVNSGSFFVNRRSSNDSFGGSSTITVMEVKG
jgi:hypothetical protein